MANPVVATAIAATLGIALGASGYQLVWPLFGAANQLLAALGLLAVCAWLTNAGKSHKMLYFPMGFMMVVTLTSLTITSFNKIVAIASLSFGPAEILQLAISLMLLAFAVVLAVRGAKVLFARGSMPKET